MGDAKFSRIFGTPVLVKFGTVIVVCRRFSRVASSFYMGDAKFSRIFGTPTQPAWGKRYT